MWSCLAEPEKAIVPDEPYTPRMQPFLSLNPPRPIHVTVDEGGMPASVVRSGRQLPVTAVVDTWRIDDEWWRDEISRRYHRLALADGTTLTVVADLIAGGWYAQRYP